MLEHDRFGNIYVITVQDGVAHRRPIAPNDPLDGEDKEVRELAAKIWTPEIIQTAKERDSIDPRETIEAMRFERNRRLAASDWTQVPDAPTDKARWAIYRQMLRDMDFTNPVWPIAPADDLTPEQTLEMERQLDRYARTLLFDGKNKQEHT